MAFPNLSIKIMLLFGYIWKEGHEGFAHNVYNDVTK